MFSIGTELYYADKYTGKIGTVVVDEVDEYHFFFYFGGKKYRGSGRDIGIRLFTNRTAAIRAYNLKEYERSKYEGISLSSRLEQSIQRQKEARGK